MKKQKQKKPAILNFRNEWTINPVTRVKANKKGKGSYNRQAFKKGEF